MNRNGSALRVEGLSKRFGGVQAVADVDLDVGYGQRISIIGPNGAGKSTLFNTIAGEYKPTAGSIHMFGDDVTRRSIQWRAHAGLARTFQTSRLFNGMSVADNLYVSLCGLPGSVKRLRHADKDDERRARAVELAERVGLEKKMDDLVGEVSHGEQRQLEVAMALGGKTRLLMLDEPAAGLSPSERGSLTSLLQELDEDITLLLIEHDMDIALKVGERVVVMSDGEKVLEGSPDEVRSSSMVREIYLGGDLHAE
ncbi:MAG: ABC transporter ATP-binding protein [Nitriliruptor sp.]|nr:MAG: ABC transporter ATP-binding protein [Nitriliruptor sp.]